MYFWSLSSPAETVKSLVNGYTNRYPFFVQMEQLQVLVGYSGNGGESEKVKRTAPQWQLPWWELRLEVGVGGMVMVGGGVADVQVMKWDGFGSLLSPEGSSLGRKWSISFIYMSQDTCWRLGLC